MTTLPFTVPPYRIVLFNGPPSSGKDTGAQALHEHVREHFPTIISIMEKFSLPIKLAFAGATRTQCTLEGWNSSWEHRKNDIVPEFGVSYRQWQIDFSENFMKKLYGEEIFSNLYLSRLDRDLGFGEQYPPMLSIVSDCGFQRELMAVTRLGTERGLIRGPESIMVIRLFRTGRTFQGDSREYVLPNWNHVKTYDIYNNGTLEDFDREIQSCFNDWLSRSTAGQIVEDFR